MSDHHCHSPACTCRDRTQALELLEKHHSFPGAYTFKIIGFNAEGLLEDVRRVAQEAAGPMETQIEVRGRPSKGCRYLSVTLELEVTGAEQVLKLYDALRRVPGVMALV